MSILVAGRNETNQLVEGNCDTSSLTPIGIDFSTIKSYSIYFQHAVIVLETGKPCAIGDNSNWPIYATLGKSLKEWTEFEISENGKNYLVESAVCGDEYTLYLVKKSKTDANRYLAYVQKGKKKGHPYFLNTNDWTIVSIYGGCQTAAGIDERGAIHIIPLSITSTKGLETKIVFLPSNGLAISVAFQEKYIIALSSYNKLYEMKINSNEFKLIEELNNEFIKSISGKDDHCIAVGINGSVFARGKNEDGRLGLGNTNNSSKFSQIQVLRSQEIVDAAAGTYHSVFVSKKGKVYTCGYDGYGELLQGKAKDSKITGPKSVKGVENACFCMAGSQNTVIFVDCEIPKNSPNQTIQLINPSPFPLMIKRSDDEEDYSSLKKENEYLKNMNKQLQASNAKLKNTNKQLQSSNKKLLNTTNQQKNTISQRKKEYEKLKKEIKTLKNQAVAPPDPAATFSGDKKKFVAVQVQKQLSKSAKKVEKPLVIKKRAENPLVIKKNKDPIKHNNDPIKKAENIEINSTDDESNNKTEEEDDEDMNAFEDDDENDDNDDNDTNDNENEEEDEINDFDDDDDNDSNIFEEDDSYFND